MYRNSITLSADELNALCSVSAEAKILYVMGIKPQSENTDGGRVRSVISLVDAARALADADGRVKAAPRQILRLLSELTRAGLIVRHGEVAGDGPAAGIRYLLPKAAADAAMPAAPAMPRPSRQAAAAVGIPETLPPEWRRTLQERCPHLSEDPQALFERFRHYYARDAKVLWERWCDNQFRWERRSVNDYRIRRPRPDERIAAASSATVEALRRRFALE